MTASLALETGNPPILSPNPLPEAVSASARTGQGALLLGGLFRAYRGRLIIAYSLVSAENLLQLAQPWALGLAINDLLRSSAAGLGILALIHLAHLLVSAARRMYDARAFTRIYADLATQLVDRQRRNGVDLSRVAARSALSREFVQFFQCYLPLVVQAFFSLGGAVVILWLYDWSLMAICLGLVGPACVVNYLYSRKVLRLNVALHDELEREVGVIQKGDLETVSCHYRGVSLWRIKLADAEAVNFTLIEFFVIALMSVTLMRSCLCADASAGGIVAIFRYVITFVTALDTLPVLIQHCSRLRDIGRRMQLGIAEEVEPSATT